MKSTVSDIVDILRQAYRNEDIISQKEHQYMNMQINHSFRMASMRTFSIPSHANAGKPMLNYHFDKCFSIRLKKSDKDI